MDGRYTSIIGFWDPSSATSSCKIAEESSKEAKLSMELLPSSDPLLRSKAAPGKVSALPTTPDFESPGAPGADGLVYKVGLEGPPLPTPMEYMQEIQMQTDPDLLMQFAEET